MFFPHIIMQFTVENRLLVSNTDFQAIFQAMFSGGKCTAYNREHVLMTLYQAVLRCPMFGHVSVTLLLLPVYAAGYI